MNKESKSQILVKNTTWIYIGKFVTQLLGVIVSIFVIRKLSVEEYGTFNFLVASFIGFQVIALQPIQSILNRYIPEIAVCNDWRKICKFLGFALLFSSIIMIVLITLLVFFKDQYGKLFNIIDFNKYFIPFLIYIVLHYVKLFLTTTISALLLHKQLSLIKIINSTLYLIFYIYYLPVLTVNLMLYIASGLAILNILFNIYVVGVHIWKMALANKNISRSKVNKSRVLRYGIIAFFNEIAAGIIGNTSDYFIISAMGNQMYTGIFSFATKLKNLFNKLLPVTEFKTVLRPLFFQKFSQEYNKKDFNQLYNFIVKVMVPIFTIPAIYFVFFGKAIIINIYDPKYIEAYILTCIILISNIEIGVFYPVVFTVQLLERNEIQLYSKIIAVISIFLGILGMKYFGLIGVITVTSLSNIFKKIFVFLMIKKKAGINYRIIEMKNYIIVFSGLILFGFIVQDYLINLFPIIIISFFFFISALSLLIIFHPFTTNDLLQLERICSSSKPLNHLKKYVVKFFNYTAFMRFNVTR
jgi:O-antigen/teichoic acid export membrane protein